ncbi:hypothetical protein [Chondrinema litorale]|uniref:OmpA family protein n=1 Tax=Chondrinema litorale TaxID=2994555 RepID=UPI0025435C7E|nr:hypothetical protein [Chondrinema litorale]UZR95546.1 hypothetical protein OQ292_06930 [Chondrinema litorale]
MSILKKICFFYLGCFFICLAPQVWSQVTAKKLLPRNINVPFLNQLAPSISGDGNHLVFLSDQVSSKRLNMMYSKRTGSERWTDPEVISVIDNSFEINHLRGYSISYDGSMLFFTTLKSGGIGGYDIWMVRKNGNSWSQPENLGKPLNSDAHEGDPSLSPDGKYLYFMRCEKMSMNNAENCTLYVSEKKNRTFWGEPVALPANINSGNAVSPRILPDNESLYFSSNKSGGQGGYDLYLTRKEDEGWTEPVALSFLNSEADDRYVSLNAKGDVIYFSMKYKDKDKIIMAKIPDEFQPLKIFQINGKILNEVTGNPEEAYIQVFDVETQKMVRAVKAPQNTGEFYVLLKSGEMYDLSVNTIDKSIIFYSELVDLRYQEESEYKNVELKLKPVKVGTTFTATNILFEPYTSNIHEASVFELKRLSLLLKNNPDINLEIGAHLAEYKSDSIQSDPDLTEVVIDTILIENNLELSVDNTLSSDTDIYTNNKVGIDSMVMVQKPDSSMVFVNVNKVDTTQVLESSNQPFQLKYTYHNDRTEAEAKAVYDYLIEIGVPSDRISYKGYGDTKPLSDVESIEKNKWIDIRLY